MHSILAAIRVPTESLDPAAWCMPELGASSLGPDQCHYITHHAMGHKYAPGSACTLNWQPACWSNRLVANCYQACSRPVIPDLALMLDA
jgi:hypothetical protein